MFGILYYSSIHVVFDGIAISLGTGRTTNEMKTKQMNNKFDFEQKKRRYESMSNKVEKGDSTQRIANARFYSNIESDTVNCVMNSMMPKQLL